MAQAVRTGSVTPADELRELLTASEKLAVNVRGQGASALRLLENLDRIDALWPQLEAGGVDLRPEAGRWATVQALVHKHAAAIAYELRAAGGLPALRAEHLFPGPSPARGADGPGERWWWYLDREVRSRRRSQFIRFGSIAAIAVIAIAGGILLFQKLFPVDPKVSAASDSMSRGQQLIDANHDYAAALPKFQAAANLTPNDSQPWILVGAAEEKLGNAAAAEQAYAHARSLLGTDLDFRLARAAIYTEFNMLDQARADLDAALKADPGNPQAYYYLATIEEGQGNAEAAIQDLQQAGDSAENRGLVELVAMSRVRMGILMQQLQAQPAGAGTATP